ncbi:MAG: hypothetical protein P4L85_19615 [Paludisphaera borealis]|uniref:hypothetical protein n=1 Tax=Paludisphaera borealis TaxID=1387353 RepID=UPI00284DF617|nr:hypothetical protein [Paludisphaera borealis]MDR3621569.1 hypothetical protein [Paludisphaera borealis]
MTLETLIRTKSRLAARGVDVDSLQARDLFNPKLDRETKDVLLLDLRRRDCEKRSLELAAK